MGERWRVLLREARERLGLSQADLAQRAGLSPETVRAYEMKNRHPDYMRLRRLLDELGLERSQRNQILRAVGFPADGYFLRPQNDDLMFTKEEAAAEVERYPWPSFVSDEFAHVPWANAAARVLWGVDLEREFTDPVDRNLLSVASNPRFAERCLNWDEAVGTIVSVFKGHHRGPQDVEQPTNPYFAQVLEKFLAGDPRYVARLLRLFEERPPAKAKMRWTYRVIWQDPEAGKMTFRCFASSANEWDGLAFHDWIPTDAGSWTALERLDARERGRRAAGERPMR
jgi:transcriptional regulator with XRE-family HTH domain